MISLHVSNLGIPILNLCHRRVNSNNENLLSIDAQSKDSLLYLLSIAVLLLSICKWFAFAYSDPMVFTEADQLTYQLTSPLTIQLIVQLAS